MQLVVVVVVVVAQLVVVEVCFCRINVNNNWGGATIAQWIHSRPSRV